MSEILIFEDYYGDYQIGQHGKKKAQYGSSGKHTSNPTDICIKFRTPSNREEEVGFYAGDSMAMGGDRVLVISSEPYARKEDDGLVGFMEYNNGDHAPRISCFVNDTSTDPKPTKVRDSSQQEEYSVDRTTWLKPSKYYFAHLYRTHILQSGAHNPLVLEVSGTDSGDQSELGRQVIIDGVEYRLVPA